MLSNSSMFHLRKPQIPVFKGHSYEYWSIKMKTLFMSEGLWDFVESDRQESDGKVCEEYQRKDAKALLYIQQAVDESIFPRIAAATSAKQAWSFIKTDYQESNKMSKLSGFQDAHIEAGLPKRLTKERMSQPSIGMVPRIIRDCRPSSYGPRMVSIGPLHRENENLQPNEEKKAIYAFSLLTRVGKTQKETLQACADKVYASIDKIRSCYDVPIIYNNIELTKMMVMDGCFILELYGFHKANVGDVMFMELAGDDLLLLENQIPFFVLDDIFECTASGFDQKTSLINLFERLLEFANVFSRGAIRISLDLNTPQHILGLAHKFYKFQNAESSRTVKSAEEFQSFAEEFQNAESSHTIELQDDESSHTEEFQNAAEEFQVQLELKSDALEGLLSSAVQLDKAGVKFKPSSHTEWPYMIKVISTRSTCFPCFWSRPTIIMPALKIDSSTECILRNLIAYEQLIGPETNYIIAKYVRFMDKLIDAGEDIAMLVESKVIYNDLGSNEEAASMINSICKYIVDEPFY